VVFAAMGLNFDGFKLGGLREKYAVATWNMVQSQHLFKDRRKLKKHVSAWPVAGPSGCTLTYNVYCIRRV
jgi:hypothetical protein